MKKLNEKKGFTLAELLVVVAIIAVLVAVSIPIFTSQLEKARESTDLANLRAAKAAATTAVLSEDSTDKIYNAMTATDTATIYYNAKDGKLVTAVGDADKCGKGTTAGTYKDGVKDSTISVSYTKATGKLSVFFTTDDTKTGSGTSQYSDVIGA